MNSTKKEFVVQEVHSTDELELKFLEVLLENLSDVEHMRFSRHSKMNHTLKTTTNFIEEHLASGGRYFQVNSHDLNNYLGTFTITPKNEVECEAGILIFRGVSNRGLGLKVWGLIPELISSSGFTKMIAGCHNDNVAMRKIMTNSGMSQLVNQTLESDVKVEDGNVYFLLELI